MTTETREKELALLDGIFNTGRELAAMIDEESRLLERLGEVEHAITRLGEEQKQQIESIHDQLCEIRGVDPPPPRPELNETEPQSPELESEPADTNAGADAEPTKEAGGMVPWRERKTEIIFAPKGITGLGKGKARILAERFPTLGDLDDLYQTSLVDGVPFEDMLPKGFGEQLANDLIGRLAKEQGESLPEEVKDESGQKKEQRMKLDDHAKFVISIEKSLRSEVGKTDEDSQAGVLSSQSDQETWEAGSEAFANGKKIESCPRDLTQHYQTDWVRGWLSAELEQAEAKPEPAGSSQGEGQPVESEPASEPTPEPASEPEPEPADPIPAADLNLAAIMDKIVAEDPEATDFPALKYQPIHDIGFSQGVEMVPVESLDPAHHGGDIDKAIDLVRGWLAGSNL